MHRPPRSALEDMTRRTFRYAPDGVPESWASLAVIGVVLTALVVALSSSMPSEGTINGIPVSVWTGLGLVVGVGMLVIGLLRWLTEPEQEPVVFQQLRVDPDGVVTLDLEGDRPTSLVRYADITRCTTTKTKHGWVTMGTALTVERRHSDAQTFESRQFPDGDFSDFAAALESGMRDQEGSTHGPSARIHEFQADSTDSDTVSPDDDERWWSGLPSSNPGAAPSRPYPAHLSAGSLAMPAMELRGAAAAESVRPDADAVGQHGSASDLRREPKQEGQETSAGPGDVALSPSKDVRENTDPAQSDAGAMFGPEPVLDVDHAESSASTDDLKAHPGPSLPGLPPALRIPLRPPMTLVFVGWLAVLFILMCSVGALAGWPSMARDGHPLTLVAAFVFATSVAVAHRTRTGGVVLDLDSGVVRTGGPGSGVDTEIAIRDLVEVRYERKRLFQSSYGEYLVLVPSSGRELRIAFGRLADGAGCAVALAGILCEARPEVRLGSSVEYYDGDTPPGTLWEAEVSPVLSAERWSPASGLASGPSVRVVVTMLLSAAVFVVTMVIG